MKNVKDILARKQFHFHKVLPGISVEEARQRMYCQHMDYLIVMDEDDRFVGLLTEHDIAVRAILQDQFLGLMQVREIMNTQLPAVDIAHKAEDCIRIMRRFDVRHLPVFDEHNFVGVLSADDILEEMVCL